MVLGLQCCQFFTEELWNIAKHYEKAPLNSEGLSLNEIGLKSRLRRITELMAPVARKLFGFPESVTITAMQVRFSLHPSTEIRFRIQTQTTKDPRLAKRILSVRTKKPPR